MANDHKDYSGTPLPKKLGIGDGSRVLLVNAPDGFDRVLTPMPDGAKLLKRTAKPLDVAVLFATEQAELIRWFDQLAASLDAVGTALGCVAEEGVEGRRPTSTSGSRRGSASTPGWSTTRARRSPMCSRACSSSTA